MNENKGGMDIVSKMIITGSIAIAVIVLGAVLFAIFGNNNSSKSKTNNQPSKDEGIIITDTKNAEDKKQHVVKEYVRALAVVKYVDVTAGKLMIYDIEKMATATLAMDSAVEIKDEYGTDIALGQIELGDMIETKYDGVTMKPENVKITAVTWERKDVSNMEVDTTNMTIRIANDEFLYTEELITSDDGVPFDLASLNPADEVVLKGYKNHVWSIVLLNGHGTIKLMNHSGFVGGNIEIGNRNSMMIESTMVIPISAGVHNVVITKEGMAPYVTQVMVEEGGEAVIDLSEAQPKVGIIEFVLMQEGTELYMDNQLVDLSQEIKLDFDTYQIRAEKEGFTPWESELVLNQAYLQYKIDLEKTPSYLHINEPEGVEAYLDGEYIGIVPVKTPYNPGTHRVTLRKDGFHTFNQDFYWADNEKDEYIVVKALTPMAGETDDQGDAETTDPVIGGDDNDTGDGDGTKVVNPSP